MVLSWSLLEVNVVTLSLRMPTGQNMTVLDCLLFSLAYHEIWEQYFLGLLLRPVQWRVSSEWYFYDTGRQSRQGCSVAVSAAVSWTDMATSTDTCTSSCLMAYFWELDPIVSQISLLFLYGNLYICWNLYIFRMLKGQENFSIGGDLIHGWGLDKMEESRASLQSY